MNRTFSVDTNHNPNNTVIQSAIDAAAQAGGGIVEVPAGIYHLRDAVHLRSNVHLVGESGTVLIKEASIESPLVHFCGFGLREFVPRDPELFEIGMGICLSDKNAFGFYTTVATIVDQRGDRFYVDRPFHHDYLPVNGAIVATLFPLVDGLGITDASIENIVLDGNVEETRQLNGCLGGGVILLGSQRITVRGTEVRHFNGDAISFQQCTDIFVRACHVHDNSGGGLHPGSGSVRYVLEENHSHHNGGHGLFYCLRTTHSRCQGNLFEWNGKTGISVGELDTDHWITGNTIAHNGEAGIDFRPPLGQGGDRVTVENNKFAANSSKVPGAEIVIPDGLNDIVIINNEFEASGPVVSLGNGLNNIHIVGNRINGGEQGSEHLAGERHKISTDPLDTIPRHGPVDLPSDGAKHLGIPLLAPWAEAQPAV